MRAITCVADSRFGQIAKARPTAFRAGMYCFWPSNLLASATWRPAADSEAGLPGGHGLRGHVAKLILPQVEHAAGRGVIAVAQILSESPRRRRLPRRSAGAA